MYRHVMQIILFGKWELPVTMKIQAETDAIETFYSHLFKWVLHPLTVLNLGVAATQVLIETWINWNNNLDFWINITFVYYVCM